jgi:hypothetical protein
MTDEPVELHYQETPPIHRRKTTRRFVLFILVVIVLGASLPLAARAIDHFRVRSLYEQCCRIDPKRTGYSFLQSNLSPLPEWKELNARMSTNVGGATIFLGKLRTPDGQREYLVGIDVTGLVSHGGATGLWTRVRTLTPPRIGSTTYGPSCDPTIGIDSQNFVLHGGIVDPDDPSHITLRYESPKVEGVIDGWFKNDATVVFESRKPTVKAPAPPSPAMSR